LGSNYLESLFVAVLGQGSGDEAKIKEVWSETVEILWCNVFGIVAHTQLQWNIPLHNHADSM